jgi:hypothetical protein
MTRRYKKLEERVGSGRKGERTAERGKKERRRGGREGKKEGAQVVENILCHKGVKEDGREKGEGKR